MIETILRNPKVSNKGDGEFKVYRDEPIIRPAAQLSNYLPPEYREMKALAKGYDYYQRSDPALFYRQGKLMESFEDDFDYHGEFSSYYPTYASMNDFQLRGYFSWRTKLRHGAVEKTSLAFAFVYIYELLNQIGVSNAQEGFYTLRKFWTDYRIYDFRLDHYVRLWLCDYVVYYDLDKSLLEEFTDSAYEKKLTVLFNYSSYGEDEVFDAINTFSSYNLENSRFFKEYSEDVKAVACGVFARMSEYYIKKNKYDLCTKLFGGIFLNPYQMFQSAVFYDTLKRKSFTYIVSDIHKYSCENGRWRCKKYYGISGKNKQLGAMMKAIDCLMREKYDFGYKLKPVKVTKIFLKTAQAELDSYYELTHKIVPPKIEIDLSQLDEIRRAAEETKDKLIVEDEPEYEILPETDADSVCDDCSQVKSLQDDSERNVASSGDDFEAKAFEAAEGAELLSPEEYRLLQCLLYGREYSSFLREKGLLLSVVADSVNEKLFEILGDTALIFEGDTPQVLEDYTDQLKGIIKP